MTGTSTTSSSRLTRRSRRRFRPVPRPACGPLTFRRTKAIFCNCWRVRWAARNILEIGTLGGYSTIWLARALPAGGRLITLEAEPKHAEVARGNIARAGLAGIVELRLGRAIESLPQLAAEGRGPFDLIFIDADKPSYVDYFGWALKLSRRGTVIIGDNVIRKGAVADASSEDEMVQGVRRFNEAVAAEPRVTATAMQTVGSKGYDGFTIALVVGALVVGE